LQLINNNKKKFMLGFCSRSSNKNIIIIITIRRKTLSGSRIKRNLQHVELYTA
jgi:hypothetical protein